MRFRSSMESSLSSSSYDRMTYDVFLSFRGETRGSFSDHLYTDLRRAGVHTFRDDESIRRGENISVELSRAIEESRISIIVFSKDYAGSRWCLDELLKIMECKQRLNQIVYPIFYHVDPSEVRKQTSTFGDALTLHKQRFGDQKVNEWKDALIAAANLSGWDLQTMPNGYESKLIEVITKEVLRVLSMNVAKHPIGRAGAQILDTLTSMLEKASNKSVKSELILDHNGIENIFKTKLLQLISVGIGLHPLVENKSSASEVVQTHMPETQIGCAPREVLQPEERKTDSLCSSTFLHTKDNHGQSRSAEESCPVEGIASGPEWIEMFEVGVYVTLTALSGGRKISLKRLRFSRKRFTEKEAEKWWSENKMFVYQRYHIGTTSDISQD